MHGCLGTGWGKVTKWIPLHTQTSLGPERLPQRSLLQEVSGTSAAPFSGRLAVFQACHFQCMSCCVISPTFLSFEFLDSKSIDDQIISLSPAWCPILDPVPRRRPGEISWRVQGLKTDAPRGNHAAVLTTRGSCIKGFLPPRDPQGQGYFGLIITSTVSPTQA